MSKLARLSVGLFLLAFALPVFAQMGPITGTATNQQGQPIVGATVVFQRTDINATYKVRTNKKGQFMHYGLPLGTFNVILYGPDGQKLSEFNNVHNQYGQPTEVDFDLKKMSSSSGPGAAANTSGMSQAQIAELAKRAKEAEEGDKKVKNLNAELAQNRQLGAAKQWGQAITLMQQAEAQATEMKLNAKNMAVVDSALAQDYAGAGQNQNAITEYQKVLALNLDPATQATTLINMGNAEVKAGNTAGAEADFDKAAQTDPGNAPIAYFNEGAILSNAGDLDGAIAAFKKALQADPKYANAWFYLGTAYLGKATADAKTGKTTYPAGTAEAFEQYLKLEPNGPNAQAAASLLKTVGGSVDTSYRKRR